MNLEKNRYTTVTISKDTHEKLVYLKYGIGVRNMTETIEFLIDGYIKYLKLRDKLVRLGLWDKVWNEINKEL